METSGVIVQSLGEYLAAVLEWTWFFVPGVILSLAPLAEWAFPSIKERLNAVILKGATSIGLLCLFLSTFAAFHSVNVRLTDAEERLDGIENDARGMLQADDIDIAPDQNNQMRVRAMLKNASPSRAIELVVTRSAVSVDGITYVPPSYKELFPLGPNQTIPMTLTSIPIEVYKPGQDRYLTTILEANYGFVGTGMKQRLCRVSKCFLRANQSKKTGYCDTTPICDSK